MTHQVHEEAKVLCGLPVPVARCHGARSKDASRLDGGNVVRLTLAPFATQMSKTQGHRTCSGGEFCARDRLGALDDSRHLRDDAGAYARKAMKWSTKVASRSTEVCIPCFANVRSNLPHHTRATQPRRAISLLSQAKPRTASRLKRFPIFSKAIFSQFCGFESVLERTRRLVQGKIGRSGCENALRPRGDFRRAADSRAESERALEVEAARGHEPVERPLVEDLRRVRAEMSRYKRACFFFSQIHATHFEEKETQKTRDKKRGQKKRSRRRARSRSRGRSPGTHRQYIHRQSYRYARCIS